MDNSGTFLSPRGRSPQKTGPTLGPGLGSPLPSQASVPPTAPAAPLIEEETRSSFTDQPPSKPPSPVGEPPLEETGGTPSQSMDGTEDSKSGKTAKKKLRCSDLQIAEQALARHDTLLEHDWPLLSGQTWILQDNLAEFVGIKNIKRRYPELTRRNIESDEREFLRAKGYVTDMQCDLGLVALRWDEVGEIIAREFPEKFSEWEQQRKERAKKILLERKAAQSAPPAQIDKAKMAEIGKKAIEAVYEYNMRLNTERIEERSTIFDLQTYTLLYPAQRRKVFAKPKLGSYPVAIIPGQYQDYYRAYTPHELKYLPLSTVLYGPVKEIDKQMLDEMAAAEETARQEDEEAGRDGCCSNSECDDTCHPESEESEEEPDETGSNIKVNWYETTEKRKLLCKDCEKDTPGLVFRCSDCSKWHHLRCLDLPSAEPEYLKKYPWQCMECKTCFVCKRPDHEDQMICCDQCDRGHHTFCVGLFKLPPGGWVCRHCGECYQCGVYKPDWYEEDEDAQWVHEYKRGPISIKEKRKVYQIYCTKCRTPRPRKPRPSYLNVKKESDDGTPAPIDDKAAGDLIDDQEMKDVEEYDKEQRTGKEIKTVEHKDVGNNHLKSTDISRVCDQVKKEHLGDVKAELKEQEGHAQLMTTPIATVTAANLPSSKGRPIRRGRGRGRRVLAGSKPQPESNPAAATTIPTPMEEQ